MRFPKIPNYEIKEQISANRTAKVYRAIHLPLRREVALKVSAIETGFADENHLKRFLSEARITANLEHINIINVYDTGRHEDLCYFSMEYLSMGSLRDKFEKDNRPAIEWSLEIILQMASALRYTHSRGYIHRDIKPENILFRDTTHIVLSDFGIAKRKKNNTNITQSRLMLGSPQYMAPEQALDHHADSRSDIYSLGVIIYELLSGQKAYDETLSYLDNFQAIQKAVTKLDGELAVYQPVLSKLLTQNPDDRFQTVDIIIDLFQKAKSELISKKQRSAPKKTIILYLGSACAAVGLLLFIFGVFLFPEKEQISAPPVIPNLIPKGPPKAEIMAVPPVRFSLISKDPPKAKILAVPPVTFAPFSRGPSETELLAVPPVIFPTIARGPSKTELLAVPPVPFKPIPRGPSQTEILAIPPVIFQSIARGPSRTEILAVPPVIFPTIAREPSQTEIVAVPPVAFKPIDNGSSTTRSLAITNQPQTQQPKPIIDCILKLDSCRQDTLSATPKKAPNRPVVKAPPKDSRQETTLACILKLEECTNPHLITTHTKD